MVCTEQKIDCAGISKMPNAQCNACFGSLRSWAAFSYKTKTAKLKIWFSVICNCFWSKLAHLNCINWKITALNCLSNFFLSFFYQILFFCPVPRKVKHSWKVFFSMLYNADILPYSSQKFFCSFKPKLAFTRDHWCTRSNTAFDDDDYMDSCDIEWLTFISDA